MTDAGSLGLRQNAEPNLPAEGMLLENRASPTLDYGLDRAAHMARAINVPIGLKESM